MDTPFILFLELQKRQKPNQRLQRFLRLSFLLYIPSKRETNTSTERLGAHPRDKPGPALSSSALQALQSKAFRTLVGLVTSVPLAPSLCFCRTMIQVTFVQHHF